MIEKREIQLIITSVNQWQESSSNSLYNQGLFPESSTQKQRFFSRALHPWDGNGSADWGQGLTSGLALHSKIGESNNDNVDCLFTLWLTGTFSPGPLSRKTGLPWSFCWILQIPSYTFGPTLGHSWKIKDNENEIKWKIIHIFHSINLVSDFDFSSPIPLLFTFQRVFRLWVRVAGPVFL